MRLKIVFLSKLRLSVNDCDYLRICISFGHKATDKEVIYHTADSWNRYTKKRKPHLSIRTKEENYNV